MDGDYLFGSAQAEAARLAEQHELWRAWTEKALAKAGFQEGDTLLDLGAGPGLATRDLAALAGPSGRVVAYDNSRSYVAAIDSMDFPNITAVMADLDQLELEANCADGVLCRWVLTFLADPARLVGEVARALRPGGSAVFIDFSDYARWQAVPPDPDLAAFRDLVIRTCSKTGTDGQVAKALPEICARAGLEVVSHAVSDAPVDRGDPRWRWLELILTTQPHRLCELGECSPADAERFVSIPDRLEGTGRMIPPAMDAIVVRKR